MDFAFVPVECTRHSTGHLKLTTQGTDHDQRIPRIPGSAGRPASGLPAPIVTELTATASPTRNWPSAWRQGWTEIIFVQTYEQSLAIYENPADAPAGHDVTAWYTHLGLCPDCRAETDECE